MKKIERVLRELLYLAFEEKTRKTTQAHLASRLQVSLSTVNLAISHLRKMNAVQIAKRSLVIINPKKILFYWASIRTLEKDILIKTRVEGNVSDIEKSMPSDVVFGAYSAYKLQFSDQPADYSEVYVYASNPKEVLKRFIQRQGPPNLIVLKKECPNMTLAHLFVDLWNMREWYAKEFLRSLEEKLDGVLA